MKLILLIGLLAAQAQMPDSASVQEPVVITLEDALKTALSENVSVKVADREIERTKYAKKGTYASLFPQIDASASYQRTIKKQMMYMDVSIPGMEGGGGGFEVGRWNTWNAGISASMPLVNAQLWKSIHISGEDVELAVEKARGSRLETVGQVKNAYYAVLLAKELATVYAEVYQNAVSNLEKTQRNYNAQKASEMDLVRAKTAVANAVPNVYDSQNSVFLTLWQLKAVMGIDLDYDVDVAGRLADYADAMLYGVVLQDDADLSSNSTLRQLEIQAEQLAQTIKLQQAAYIPTLSLGFNYSLNAMQNDFNFSEYKWSPYSYVGLSLQIPIFSGGKRYHSVKQARVRAEELDLQREETERQLRIAIRQYTNSMETAIKSYASGQSAVESAQKAYDITSRSYELGRCTLTDLGDAQLALVQAQLSLHQAVYTYVTSKAGLEQVLGKDYQN
ncbi:MAG: TolC family protein [Bacteroidales bacterium]|nr:TolC family protein [Bacteroidales bacterium]